MADYDDRPRFSTSDEDGMDVRTDSASFVASLLETDLEGLLKDIDQLTGRLKAILPDERKEAEPVPGAATSPGESILVRRLNQLGRTITAARTLINELSVNVQP